MAQPWLDTVVGSVLTVVKIVALRVVIHLAALVLVGLSYQAFGDVLLSTSVWAGIVCLIPYGSPRNPYWWIPVAAGCVQALVLLPLLPWAFFALPAGLLTWTLRLVIARGNIGWDWTAAPALALGLYAAVGNLLDWQLPLLPLLSFPILFALGLAGYRMFNRIFHSNVHRQMLAASLVRLRTVLQSASLGENEKRHCSLLLSQSEALGLYKDCPDELVDRIVNITGELEDLSRSLASKPAWTRTLFKSTQWQHLGKNTYIQGGRLTGEGVLQNVQELNADLARTLASLKKSANPGKASAEQDDAVALDTLSLSASELLGKKGSLPDGFGRPLEDIAFTAMDMIGAMRKDPADRRTSLRFLERYLPRVHHVVDEYARMEKDLPPETRQRTIEVLEQLAASFDSHRQGMTRNDTIGFTAELDALDALLKMRSR
ncbi:MAG: hypothetical protein Q4F72_03695 [Desulfovibrionaceae bacterium]|nr:hypothetical protein [Desulfovibrionaceae bacterium]